MFPDALPSKTLAVRQLWNLPISQTQTHHGPSHCTPFTLPSNGVLSFADTALTLSSNVIFQPECTGKANQGVSQVDNLREPFYASTIPQVYVVAAATVIAWILMVMLIITPRTSFFGGSGASPNFRSGHGIIGGATGGGNGLTGVGSRPWVQKVATLTVAVSLTIATADTFKVAQHQYNVGFMNANALRDQVLGSLEIRITRVISDVFLWLAQVQTLIRLFPRHKEKVLIKWIGFALIVFDSTFSCLNSFLVESKVQPRQFADAIPAVSYLFELALGLLYASWVIYYAATKRRYAFYHPKMRNICLIALISLVAVLTPVVFFVTDVSNQDVASWGDYFRWVGAAAASVVVWEWVERIEALERDEKKDGILGREIFDGDEMLDIIPSEEAVYFNTRKTRKYKRSEGGRSDDEGSGGNQSSALENGLGGIARRFRRYPRKRHNHFPLGRAHSSTAESTPEAPPAPNGTVRVTFGHLPKPNGTSNQRPTLIHPTPPPSVASPVSRTETSSAASTVYVVRYDTETNAPQPVRRRHDRETSGNAPQLQGPSHAQDQRRSAQCEPLKDESSIEVTDEIWSNRNRDHQSRWQAVTNPFKRKRALPPAEVQAAAVQAMAARSATTPAHNFSKWDIKNRLGVLAAETGERIRDRKEGKEENVELPVTVIPAQPRGGGRTWSPELLHTQQARATSDGGQAEPSQPQSTNGGPVLLTRSSLQGNMGSSTDSTLAYVGFSAQQRHMQAQPPHANDIPPIRDNYGPVIIPAPKRLAPSVATSAGSSHQCGPSQGSASLDPSSRSRENG